MAARIFLILEGLGWFSYGVYCFLFPSALAESAGVVAQSPTGLTELRAMYGGLQGAIGLLALLGAFSAGLRRPALLTIAFVTAGLASTRLLGVLIDGGVSSYTVMGLAFETVSASLARWLLRGTSAPPGG